MNINNNLDRWWSFVKEIDPTGKDSHPWICEHSQNESIQLFSDKEYKNNDSIRKLRIKEIINGISFSLKSDLKETRDYLAVGGDIFSTNTDDLTNTLESQQNKLQSMVKVLKNISTHAVNKKLADKTQSIWGWVKWYIWSWFYDPTKNIEVWNKSILPQILKEHYQDISQSLKDRIIINISGFEEEVNMEESQRINFDNFEVYRDFNSHKKVHQWLKKYAPDKFHQQVSKSADTYRQRIISMAKIWSAVNSLESKKLDCEQELDIDIDTIDKAQKSLTL